MLAFYILRGESLAAVGIFAQIKLNDLVHVFAGAAFNEVFGFAVRTTFRGPLLKLTRPDAEIAIAWGRCP